MLETFTLDTFTQRLNSKFLFKYAPDGEVEMELIEATDVGSNARQTQFSIIFRGPSSILLPQSMCRVEHAELGSFDLFIVPIQHNQEGSFYEAVFNRPIR
jgi:hypothetical protein